MTDRYAVVGNPVAQSLSPRIHAVFAADTGQSLSYEALLAPVDGFVDTVESFFAAGGVGVNVTVPFKEQAWRWVDDCDPAADAAGAVNTIVRSERGSVGYNTDGAGLLRDLTANCGLDLTGARLLLLGAGGAARGVIRPLLTAGLERLVVANRTAARARELADSVRHLADVGGLGLSSVAPGFDIVVNATSAGLGEGAVAAVDPAVVSGAFCYDMIYERPGSGRPTAFCRWATANGASSTVDGLGMLVEQAALAFELWRGVAPATAPVLERLRGDGV